MAITYTQLCGMPRSERSSTAPEKWEVFVIHMLAPQPLPSSDNFFFFVFALSTHLDIAPL